MTKRLKQELLIRNRFNEMFAKKFFYSNAVWEQLSKYVQTNAKWW